MRRRRGRRAAAGLAVGVVAALGVSAPAHADPDTDFGRELQGYGIYGPKDYNAWIGKLVCKRTYNNVDHDAYQSAKFVSNQLQKGSTTEQAWQFLGLAISYYCPEKRPVLEAAAQH